MSLPDHPNILWLVAEDLSPYLAAYGDSTVSTPNLDWLAAGGVVYDRVFASSPVCAPARAALATGMYANAFGANHMRTGPWIFGDVPERVVELARQNMPDGLIPYEAIPPPDARMVSEYLRMNGYYCSNNFKEDYQFRKPPTAWDESSPEAHWRKAPEGAPWFSVFNLDVTHESQIWAKANDSLWVNGDLKVPVPPYLPDTEIGRSDVRRMYSNIAEMDAEVGRLLDQLREDGLLDKTVIMFFGDHGGPLPRQKRLLYDSGLRVPLIVRFPGAQRSGTHDGRLISFVDFAPTLLSLARLPTPAHMQGRPWLGEYAGEPRDYVFAAADRFGPNYDTNRAARNDRFKYLRYYEPDKPRFLHTPYRDQMPIMQELYRLRDEGQLTDVQAQWFLPGKPNEELFDTWEDPHELRNLATDPRYADELAELRAACSKWIDEINDQNIMPEPELVARLWPAEEQPVTGPVNVGRRGDSLILTSATPGASIGYRFVSENDPPTSTAWSIYQRPIIKPTENQELYVIAHRIGYLPSDTTILRSSDIEL